MKLRLIPRWLASLMQRIDDERQDGVAEMLERSCDRWASDTVSVFGNAAGDRLIEHYVTYSMGRYGRDETKRRNRVLRSVSSDAVLTDYQRVRMLLATIGGEFNDWQYLRGFDRRIRRWKS